MMSPKQWSALLCLHVSYLFLGATIYFHIENPLETAKLLASRDERIEILELLNQNYAPHDYQAQEDIRNKIATYCGKIMANISESEEPVPQWDFYHSFFFSYTVISTVGYGNLAPTTAFGRILMIFYALVGIPINAILFTNLGAYFSSTFKGLYERYKKKNPSSGANIDYQFSRVGLVGRIALYLFPGIVIFIFFPAILFVIFEDWDYALAVYYAFVTLSTIGFGDHVASFNDRGFGGYFIAYKIFLIFWITFGLGYLVMVVGFLTQGLKSKKVKKLERMLATNLKQTQSKIWNNVTKDIGYLRKILNEVYLMRFKPVYHDEVPTPKLHRSASSPASFGERDATPTVKRRRANSEAYPTFVKLPMKGVQSETDLLAIDRSKTFGAGTVPVQPSELLARVVDALGSLQTPDIAEEVEDDDFAEMGVHGFSDEEILAGEKNGWSIGGETIAYAVPPKTPRARAASEVKLPMGGYERDNGWTWNSLTASRLNPFARRQSKEMTPGEYLRKTARGRISLAAPVAMRETRRSNGSLKGGADVLEQTTIADLIRALSVLQPDSPTAPQRKMGAANAPPPRRSSVHPILSVGETARARSPANVSLPPAAARRRFSLHPSSDNEASTPSPPLTNLMARRRLGAGPRRYSAWAGTPNTRRRRPLFPPSIMERPRTRHESLSDVSLEDINFKE